MRPGQEDANRETRIVGPGTKSFYKNAVVVN